MKFNNQKIINDIENRFLKSNIPDIKIGDTIKIGVKIFEGNKERVQYYEGTVIAKKRFSVNLTITVRKVFQGIGVERIFLVHSPKVASIKILHSSKVRRAKLYYLKNRKGKAARLRQSMP